MSPIIHGLLAWIVAIAFVANVTDRRLIVITGIAADIDGVFVLFDQGRFLEFHHTFGHAYVFGLPMALIAGLLAKERMKTGVLAVAAFTLHLLADMFGSNWIVYPLYPLSEMGFTAGWFLSNEIIYGVIYTIVALIAVALVLGIMYFKEVSPFEFFSKRLDRIIVGLYVFPIKYRCGYCGKRAIGECTECKRKTCWAHKASLSGLKCPQCAGNSNVP